jgi:hypothetical protein
MGLKTIFTDHSLFGFSDPSAIHMNKVPHPPCCPALAPAYLLSLSLSLSLSLACLLLPLE